MKFIVAVDSQWGFAKEKKIPWHIPEDFRFFKEKTSGHPCLMGFNTYHELAEKFKYPQENKQLLPHRLCLVLSRHHQVPSSNWVKSISDLSELFAMPQELQDNLFWIGGAQIYDLALDVCQEGWITSINHDYYCDQFFNVSKLQSRFQCAECFMGTGSLRFERWVKKEKL